MFSKSTSGEIDWRCRWCDKFRAGSGPPGKWLCSPVQTKSSGSSLRRTSNPSPAARTPRWTFIITFASEIELGFMEIYGNLWAFMGISNPQLSHFPFESHFFGNVPSIFSTWLGRPFGVIKCGWLENHLWRFLKRIIEPNGDYSSTPCLMTPEGVALSTTIPLLKFHQEPIIVPQIPIVCRIMHIHTYIYYIIIYIYIPLAYGSVNPSIYLPSIREFQASTRTLCSFAEASNACCSSSELSAPQALQRWVQAVRSTRYSKAVGRSLFLRYDWLRPRSLSWITKKELLNL